MKTNAPIIPVFMWVLPPTPVPIESMANPNMVMIIPFILASMLPMIPAVARGSANSRRHPTIKRLDTILFSVIGLSNILTLRVFIYATTN